MTEVSEKQGGRECNSFPFKGLAESTCDHSPTVSRTATRVRASRNPSFRVVAVVLFRAGRSGSSDFAFWLEFSGTPADITTPGTEGSVV